MIKLWLLNNKEELKESLDLINAIHHQEVNGENTLTFECTNKIEKLDHVIYKDERDVWHEFVVQGITENKDSIQCYAEHISYELHTAYVKDRRPTTTPLGHLQSLLVDTRWTAGTVEKGETVYVSYYYLSIYDAIVKLTQTCKGELQYRIVVENNSITGRYVDILNRIGQDNGKRFTYRKDLVGITRTVLEDDIYTALVGRGKGEKIGDGWGRRITFADLNKEDSPQGIEYVFDSVALQQYGINYGGQLMHRVGIVEFDDIDDVEELYKATKERLQEVSQPQINYEVEVVLLNDEHEQIAIGDSVFVLDDDFRGRELRFHGRVIRFDKNLTHPDLSIVTIGNLIANLAQQQIQVEHYLDQFRAKSSVWDRSNAFNLDNTLEASYIKDLLREWNDRANASGGFTYAVEGQGQITYDRAIDDNPTQALQIVGGALRIADSKLPNGDWNWRTAITADGIAGEQIIAQSITANQLRSDVGASLDLSSNQSVRIVVDDAITDLDFKDGASAYELARSQGFTGTLSEWLESLKGKDGTSINVKGTKASEEQLPSTGNTLGDAWIVEGDLYVWTDEWTNVGRFQGQPGKDGIGYQLLLTSDEGLSYNPNSDLVSFTLRAQVLVNNRNVTTSLDNSYFVWRRLSTNTALDNQFNVQGLTGRTISIPKLYMQESAAYECTLTIPGISGYMLDAQGHIILDGLGRKIIATTYSLTFKQQLPITVDMIDQLNYLSTELNIAKGRLDLTLTEANLNEVVIGAINANPHQFKINWNQIDLNGWVSLNGKVQVTPEGFFKAVDGEFSGTLDVNHGVIGGFNIANDGLKKSLTKTWGPFTNADVTRIESILRREVTATATDLNKYDLEQDGSISSADWITIKQMVLGIRPNPLTITYTIEMNTELPNRMLRLYNSLKNDVSTVIGTGSIKTETIEVRNLEFTADANVLTNGTFNIRNKEQTETMLSASKEGFTVHSAGSYFNNLSVNGLLSVYGAINGLKINRNGNNIWFETPSGRVLGINDTGVYAGRSAATTSYIKQF